METVDFDPTELERNELVESLALFQEIDIELTGRLNPIPQSVVLEEARFIHYLHEVN